MPAKQSSQAGVRVQGEAVPAGQGAHALAGAREKSPAPQSSHTLGSHPRASELIVPFGHITHAPTLVRPLSTAYSPIPHEVQSIACPSRPTPYDPGGQSVHTEE